MWRYEKRPKRKKIEPRVGPNRLQQVLGIDNIALDKEVS